MGRTQDISVLTGYVVFVLKSDVHLDLALFQYR